MINSFIFLFSIVFPGVGAIDITPVICGYRAILLFTLGLSICVPTYNYLNLLTGLFCIVNGLQKDYPWLRFLHLFVCVI